MKQAGVIRRIDNLGRLVIPREFRTMQKIKAGDPLEICIIEGGDMIVRRVDFSEKLVSVSKNIIKELHKTIDLSIFLCDTEKFIFTKSDTLTDFNNMALSSDLVFSIQRNKNFVGETEIPHLGKNFYSCCYPIFTDDLFGALVVLSIDPIPEWKQKTIAMATRLIAGSLQSF